MINIQIKDYDGQGGTAAIEKYPDVCPFCHRAIAPRVWQNESHLFAQNLQILFMCPRRECQSIFIGYYVNRNGTYFLTGTSKGTKQTREFPQTISDISPNFVKIYQQAEAAEQDGLAEICGVGYRKAIEFLVKDYAIKQNPGRQEEIQNKFLGNCIEEFVDDSRVKGVAKRAVWLGNDEAHYVRQWEGKNLEDLKALIRLTVHWLEMVSETERFEREMPAKH